MTFELWPLNKDLVLGRGYLTNASLELGLELWQISHKLYERQSEEDMVET